MFYQAGGGCLLAHRRRRPRLGGHEGLLEVREAVVRGAHFHAVDLRQRRAVWAQVESILKRNGLKSNVVLSQEVETQSAFNTRGVHS